jgi:Rieske Fe-S protein
LEAWTKRWFPVRAVEHRWSAQDYMSADGLPYIGRVPLQQGHCWVATGYNKWGLTTGTAAALIIGDLIRGRDNPWATVFDATRTDVLPSAQKLVEENADVAKRFVGDRLRTLSVPALADLAPGQGGIVDDQGSRLAAYRDESGLVHAHSPLCTHLGCYVVWNAAERSWDCPCHGSRFGYRGEVLQGPAVHPLQAEATSESAS